MTDFNIAYKNGKNVIRLQDGKSFISKRKRPCVIRYFLQYDNEEEYLRALCILFLPFRNEMQDIHSKDLKLLYDEHKDTIESNRQNYEKHQTLIEIVKDAEKVREEDNDDIEERINLLIEGSNL